ncbi:hypothetical protein GCM10027035_11980 [Emticicia sediminis]
MKKQNTSFAVLKPCGEFMTFVALIKIRITMKKQITLYLTFSILLFVVSCKKDAEPTPQTRAEMLTSSPWKWVAGTVTPAYDIFGDGKPINGDYFSKAPKCWQDDIYTFTSANKFTHDEGATKCDPSDPQIYSQGTWAFETADNVIRIKTSSNPSDDSLWGINELTSTSLKVVEFYTENGKQYTFEYYFSR